MATYRLVPLIATIEIDTYDCVTTFSEPYMNHKACNGKLSKLVCVTYMDDRNKYGYDLLTMFSDL